MLICTSTPMPIPILVRIFRPMPTRAPTGVPNATFVRMCIPILRIRIYTLIPNSIPIPII